MERDRAITRSSPRYTEDAVIDTVTFDHVDRSMLDLQTQEVLVGRSALIHRARVIGGAWREVRMPS